MINVDNKVKKRLFLLVILEVIALPTTFIRASHILMSAPRSF